MQYSLRSLFVLMLLCAGGALAWRTYLAPYRQQRQTMSLIERLGGSYQSGEASVWLRCIYGQDFQNVALVNLADSDDPETYLSPIAALPKLETLVVGGPDFGDEQLAALKDAKALRNLVLDSTRVTDEALAALAASRPEVATYRGDRRTMALLVKGGAKVDSTEPTAPVELQASLGRDWLTRCRFVGSARATDDVLKRIGELTEIEILGLDDFPISDAGLEHLRKLSKLHKLHLSRTPTGDAGLAQLSKLSALQTLVLDGTRISNAGLSHLEGIAGLKYLILSDTRIGDDGLQNLAEFPSLQSLVLNGTRISDNGLVHLRRLVTLRALSLEQTNVSGAGLVHLRELPNLQSLSLECTKIGDEDLANLATLNKVRYLSLSGTEISDVGLAHLKALPLQSLTLARLWVDRSRLPELVAPRDWPMATFYGPRITDEGIASLKRFGNLSMLDVSDTEVSDAGLTQLKALKMFQRLDLGSIKCRDASLAELKQALPMCRIERHGGRLWPK